MKHNTIVRSEWIGYLYVGPWILGFTLFVAGPMFVNLIMSFSSWNLFEPFQWIGIDNYRVVFTDDPVFWIVLRNTFLWVVVANGIQVILALVAANALAGQKRGAGLMRTLWYAPSLVPTVALGIVMGFIFSGSPNGVANAIIRFLGLPSVGWLTNTRTALPTAIFTNIWFLGPAMTIFLAAISGIPRDYYDAARIDGASAVRTFFSVTIPLISSVILFNAVIAVITGWQVYDNILPLTAAADASLAAPYGREYSLGVYLIHIHQNAFRRFELGYAAALSVVLFIVVMLSTVTVFRFARSRSSYYEEYNRG